MAVLRGWFLLDQPPEATVFKHRPAHLKAASLHFTSLNDIKPAMLQEAAANARLAAAEFAQHAGTTVGRIRNARQGSFSIRDVGQEYGDTKRIEKDVRVVTTIEFYLD